MCKCEHDESPQEITDANLSPPKHKFCHLKLKINDDNLRSESPEPETAEIEAPIEPIRIESDKESRLYQVRFPLIKFLMVSMEV